jgi:hypothetical protein
MACARGKIASAFLDALSESDRIREVDPPACVFRLNLHKVAGHTNRLPVASGDRVVGTVEGKYPEREAAGFGNDPETTLVREVMVKERIIASKITGNHARTSSRISARCGP